MRPGPSLRPVLMRIAINVEQLLQPSPGGIGRYTARLLSLLGRLYPDDEVVGFCARHPPAAVAAALEAAGAGGVTQQRIVRFALPRPALLDAWQLLGVPPLAAGGAALRRIDVVHAPSAAVPPRNGARLVVSVHDVAPALFPEAFPRHGRWFHRQGWRAAQRRADVILTGTRAAAAEIVEHTSIVADRIRVVPYGVDVVSVDPRRRAEVLDRLGLTGRPYVFWVGSREPRKGLTTLVAAMALLGRRRAGEPARLVLAGYDGWLSGGEVTAADRDQLGDALVELGRVDEETLWCLHGGAAVFAFPSRHEGFGLPLLEAMSQATAVICSDLPVLREVAGGAARFVPAGDAGAWAEAIGDLLDDRSARDRLAEEGVARSRKFTWERTVSATHEVYAELARG
jgi:glycosyltransferase involved in cell wall biosynthesis